MVLLFGDCCVRSISDAWCRYFQSHWMSSNIAAAQAEQISSQTMIDHKSAELDYEQKKFYADLEMRKAQQQAAYEEQKRSQELQALAFKNAENTEFQKNFHAVAIVGAKILTGTLGLGAIFASISGGIGLNRYLTAKAQAKHNQPLIGKLAVRNDQLTREVLAIQEKVSALGQRLNHRASQPDIKNTIPFWPEDDQQLKPSDYPWVK